MITIAQAIDRATDEGIVVQDDVMIPTVKGCVPDTLSFIVRKRGRAVVCTRIKGTTTQWRVAKGRVYNGRGDAIMAAIDMILGG